MTNIVEADSVAVVEDLLRGSGVILTPVQPDQEDLGDLQTADGRFTIEPARVTNRQENKITLYRTDNAEDVPTVVNEAVKRLRKRYPTVGDFAASYPQLAGKYAFTLGVKRDGRYYPPTPILPGPVGGELCWLNPKSERFDYTRTLGVRSVCRYTGLWNPIALREHVQSKHNGVWPLIEEDRQNRFRQEERDAKAASDDRIVQLVSLVLEQRGLDVAQAPAVAQQVMERGSVTVACDECGEEFTANTKQIAAMNRARHMKTHSA